MASLPGYSEVDPVGEKESFWWYITLETKSGNEEALASLAEIGRAHV